MEKQNYIKINRVSGCSIGSIVALLYYMDALDLMSTLYNTVNEDFKQNHYLNTVTELKRFLAERIPTDICKQIDNKLFITYYDIKKGVKKVKSNYRNIDEIINTIIRSCYIPYLIDGNLLYQDKYIDGINPYIFTKEPNIKILYLDLFGYDKIGNLLNIKNEKTNFHRILSGMLDIHNFFIKQSSTPMCSYVNDWNYINFFWINVKFILEKIVIYIIYIIINIKNNLPIDFYSSIICKILTKIIQDIFVIILDTYCL
jgi:hypothetical protein